MNVFVCCSAYKDIKKEYLDDCEQVLNELLKDNDLVFGACETGLMGLAYNIAKKNGRKVTGICPGIYKGAFKKIKCDKEIVSSDMMDSTRQILARSDAIVILPGGFGTAYEIFIAIQTKICKEHSKPIIIYNSRGFYNNLIGFTEDIYKEEFATSDYKNNYLVANTKEEVLKLLSNGVYNREKNILIDKYDRTKRNYKGIKIAIVISGLLTYINFISIAVLQMTCSTPECESNMEFWDNVLIIVKAFSKFVLLYLIIFLIAFIVHIFMIAYYKNKLKKYN